jgi:hypothetical protein
MAVHMIDSILGVVFGDKNRAIFPIRTMTDRFDDATNREVVISDLRRRSREADGNSAGVIVTKPKVNQRW